MFKVNLLVVQESVTKVIVYIGQIKWPIVAAGAVFVGHYW